MGVGSWFLECAILLSPLASSLGMSVPLVAVHSFAHPSGAGPSRWATSVRGRQPPLSKLGAHAEQLSRGQGLALGWGQPPRDHSWSSTPCQGPCASSLNLWLLHEEHLAGDPQEQAARTHRRICPPGALVSMCRRPCCLRWGRWSKVCSPSDIQHVPTLLWLGRRGQFSETWCA